MSDNNTQLCMLYTRKNSYGVFGRFPDLILWRPTLPYGYSYKASQRQSARMSKKLQMLTRSGTWCFIAAVLVWQQRASKG